MSEINDIVTTSLNTDLYIFSLSSPTTYTRKDGCEEVERHRVGAEWASEYNWPCTVCQHTAHMNLP